MSLFSSSDNANAVLTCWIISIDHVFAFHFCFIIISKLIIDTPISSLIIGLCLLRLVHWYSRHFARKGGAHFLHLWWRMCWLCSKLFWHRRGNQWSWPPSNRRRISAQNSAKPLGQSQFLFNQLERLEDGQGLNGGLQITLSTATMTSDKPKRAGTVTSDKATKKKTPHAGAGATTFKDPMKHPNSDPHQLVWHHYAWSQGVNLLWTIDAYMVSKFQIFTKMYSQHLECLAQAQSSR